MGPNGWAILAYGLMTLGVLLLGAGIGLLAIALDAPGGPLAPHQ
jgi:hypothetical protein